MKLLHAICILALFLWAGSAAADQTYVVKKGDSLYKIAKKFKIDQQQLSDANGLDSSRLKPDTRLIIPSKAKAGSHETNTPGAEAAGPARTVKTDAATAETLSPQQDTAYHTVKKGDTLASVAKRYSLSAKELRELNHIAKSKKLKAGQQLIVKRTGPRTYTVKKGDNIWKIAKKFNLDPDELQDLNELDSEDVKPGQKLILEARTEGPYTGDYPKLSAARISEDIKILADSPELESVGVKERLILFARKMLNIPYRFGGSTFMGIDCSGYVQKVFGFLDVSLPRTAREQFHFGEPVAKEELSIGDLVFFRTYASFPSHVGIYLGNNLFIHASSKNRKVSIDSLDTPYYVKRFIGAKRLFQGQLDKQITLNEQG